jgi:hypothetical protein
MGIKIVVAFFCLMQLELNARPISYSGGSTLMAFSDDMKTSLYYHYSPSHKYSIGIESLNDKAFKDSYSYARLSYLVLRKNTEHSQTNLYFKSGISSKGLENIFYGINGDWETRRWFTGFSFKKIKTRSRNYREQYYQFGIAPYLGDYGDLHTWITVKIKENSLDDKWSAYPVLKFFKGNVLMELGYGKVSQWDMHLMYRF